MKNLLASTLILLWAVAPAAAAPEQDSCITCHANLEGELARPAKVFDQGIHHQAGLKCADCHGGDPTDDSMNAMSPAKGFRGAPKKTQVPEFCARCHSNIAYMHTFNPKARADQLSQYLTSVHGKRLKQGDTKVAACVDCHGVHNMLPASDSRSPVNVSNVAATCAHCHANAVYMKAYGIPTDQFSRYERSVHAATLAQGDTSAPTCTTCHGNHGATPPGVNSVANVCGTCHVFFAELFDRSPHAAAFKKLNLPGCVQCHSNHEIVKPTDAWVGVGPKAVCANCHAAGDKGYAAAQGMAADLTKLRDAIARADQTLNTAENSGMEVSSARLELASAHEDLVKARVNVHTFTEADVRKLTDAGVGISTKAHAAGIAALHERDVRRKGLGIALIAIVLAVSGLYLKIRQLESRHKV
jgi:nitrate/TMAO reductase-like tetraheme cytochrome c subunit